MGLPASGSPTEVPGGNYFAAWEKAGLTLALVDGLRDRVRLREGRAAEPSAGVIDSASLQAAETRRQDQLRLRCGQDKDRKRHIAVDTLGLLLTVMVTAASTQDRDGARPLPTTLTGACRRIRLVWDDADYSGKLVTWASEHARLRIHIVKRPDHSNGFVVLPRWWAVKRTLPGWPGIVAASATTDAYPNTTRPGFAGA